MQKFYRGIVDHPKLIITIFLAATLLCAVLQSMVGVNYDMTAYLPEDSHSTVSLELMENEFEGGIPNARVMIRNVTFDFTASNKMTVHSEHAEPWKVTVVDTGLDTMTGGRVKRIQEYIGDEPFMLTYGDGVADVNIDELVKFHKEHGHIATMTAVSVGQRFGCLGIEDDLTISSFREKSDMDGSRINAGFMVLEPKIFDYIEGDSTVFEKAPLETVASMGELDAYIHNGFWKPMDTLREKMQLEEMWANGTAPWKVW